jgi:hypothetical protein
VPEEHDRANRIYFDQPNKPVVEPPIFSSPHLEVTLFYKYFNKKWQAITEKK